MIIQSGTKSFPQSHTRAWKRWRWINRGLCESWYIWDEIKMSYKCNHNQHNYNRTSKQSQEFSQIKVKIFTCLAGCNWARLARNKFRHLSCTTETRTNWRISQECSGREHVGIESAVFFCLPRAKREMSVKRCVQSTDLQINGSSIADIGKS